MIRVDRCDQHCEERTNCFECDELLCYDHTDVPQCILGLLVCEECWPDHQHECPECFGALAWDHTTGEL